MKKLFVFFSWFILSLTVVAQGTEGSQSSTFSVSVNLTTVIDAVGFQFDMYLPEGIEVVKTDGSYAVDLGAIAKDHKVFCSKLADGSYRLLCYSMTNSCFAKNSGEVMRIQLTTTKIITQGTYPITLKKLELAKANGLDSPRQGDSDILSGKGRVEGDGTFSYEIPNNKGDVNNDGVVSMSDVNLVLNYCIRENKTDINLYMADVDEDGKVTLSDAKAITTLYLTLSNDSTVKGNINIINE